MAPSSVYLHPPPMVLHLVLMGAHPFASEGKGNKLELRWRGEIEGGRCLRWPASEREDRGCERDGKRKKKHGRGGTLVLMGRNKM